MSAPVVNAMNDNGLVLEETDKFVHVHLNRPQALNALSHPMILGLKSAVTGAAGRPVLVTGEGRAFCAGGDIKAQAAAVRAGDCDSPSAYFDDEYGFNHLLFNHAFRHVYVSYLNGIVMGGGYGISAHGSHLVTTAATQFAMPEVKIGFFPDVGAVYHLARAPAQLGTYMALTGNTVNAADMHFMGLAHAHVDHASFDALRGALETGEVDEALARFHVAPGSPGATQVIGMLEPHADLIDRCFVHDEAEAIVDALKTQGSPFAVQTAGDIEMRSPTSVKVALAHLRAAADDDFATIIARDRRLSQSFLHGHDFGEGVRAAIIDKDRNPRWKPAILSDVDAATVALYLGGMRD